MKLTLTLLVFTAILPLGAQDKSLNCDDRKSWNDNGRQQRSCEMREFPIAAVPRMIVDGRTNGGISVKGATRGDILVRARIETWAPTSGEARSIAGQINVQTAGGNVHADAPDFGSERGWSVSYEIFVPQRTDLSLKAHNGGIKIADTTGGAEFTAVNGGVALARLAGNVKGRTTNGGLKIELTGSRWEGGELNVSATNGGVTMEIPENYSARLETGTVNGHISVDFPITVSGKINKELSTNIGSGGALIRATTTNGGVSIRRKS